MDSAEWREGPYWENFRPPCSPVWPTPSHPTAAGIDEPRDFEDFSAQQFDPLHALSVSTTNGYGMQWSEALIGTFTDEEQKAPSQQGLLAASRSPPHDAAVEDEFSPFVTHSKNKSLPHNPNDFSVQLDQQDKKLPPLFNRSIPSIPESVVTAMMNVAESSTVRSATGGIPSSPLARTGKGLPLTSSLPLEEYSVNAETRQEFLTPNPFFPAADPAADSPCPKTATDATCFSPNTSHVDFSCASTPQNWTEILFQEGENLAFLLENADPPSPQEENCTLTPRTSHDLVESRSCKKEENDSLGFCKPCPQKENMTAVLQQETESFLESYPELQKYSRAADSQQEENPDSQPDSQPHIAPIAFPAASRQPGQTATQSVPDPVLYIQAIELLNSTIRSNRYPNGTVVPDETKLIQGDDHLLLTDYRYHMMMQLRPSRLTEEDQISARQPMKLGFGGLQCAHCVRKFFWREVKQLTNSFSMIEEHMFDQCPALSDDIRQALLTLKGNHRSQMKENPHGFQATYYRRVWKRIHGHQDQESSVATMNIDNGTRPSRNDRRTKKRGASSDSSSSSGKKRRRTSRSVRRKTKTATDGTTEKFSLAQPKPSPPDFSTAQPESPVSTASTTTSSSRANYSCCRHCCRCSESVI